MRKLGITILTIAALTTAGCGGGESGSIAGATDGGAAVAEADTAAHKPADPLATLERELEAAGYHVTPAQPTGAQGGLEAQAPGGAPIQVAFYREPAKAASVGRQIEGIFGNHPGRGVVEVRGGFLIDLGQERQLTTAEEKAVQEVADLAGRGE